MPHVKQAIVTGDALEALVIAVQFGLPPINTDDSIAAQEALAALMGGAKITKAEFDLITQFALAGLDGLTDQEKADARDALTNLYPWYVEGRKDTRMKRSEADILTAMAKASYTEQQRLMRDLETLRAERTASCRATLELDLSREAVEAHLTPTVSHQRHTAATDWLAGLSLEDEDRMSQRMRAEAALWLRAVSPDVLADRQEFTVQAVGMASRCASAYADMDLARAEFLTEVQRLAGITAAKSRNCENGNHSDCGGCGCSCHNKSKGYSGACQDKDHAACKMDDCTCSCHKKSGGRTAGWKEAPKQSFTNEGGEAPLSMMTDADLDENIAFWQSPPDWMDAAQAAASLSDYQGEKNRRAGMPGDYWWMDPHGAPPSRGGSKSRRQAKTVKCPECRKTITPDMPEYESVADGAQCLECFENDPETIWERENGYAEASRQARSWGHRTAGGDIKVDQSGLGGSGLPLERTVAENPATFDEDFWSDPSGVAQIKDGDDDEDDRPFLDVGASRRGAADESGQGVSGLPTVEERGEQVRVLCAQGHTWQAKLGSEGNCPECGKPAIANDVYAYGPFDKKKSSRHVTADNCSVCGDSIEKDPANEDPNTWHHNNGEKHDHEAKPGGDDGDSKEGAYNPLSDPQSPYNNPDKGPHAGVPTDLFPEGGVPLHGDLTPEQEAWLKSRKRSSRHVEAARYCKTHQVWIGPGNAANHDEACKIETRKKEASQEDRRTAILQSFGAHSTTCPKCGSKMDNVTVQGNTLKAQCACGWSGTKQKQGSVRRVAGITYDGQEYVHGVTRGPSVCASCGNTFVDTIQAWVRPGEGGSGGLGTSQDAQTILCIWCGKDIQAQGARLAADDSGPLEADESGQAVSPLPMVEADEPTVAWPWELGMVGDGPSGAADVANVPTPGKAVADYPKASRRVAFDEDAIDQDVRDVINSTSCPNCGERNNYGYNSTDGADCRTCGHQWWPPPPYAQPKASRRRVARKTRVVPSEQAGYGPGKFVAQYYDDEKQVWFDIGDPKSKEEAQAAADGGKEGRRRVTAEDNGNCKDCGAALDRPGGYGSKSDNGRCHDCHFGRKWNKQDERKKGQRTAGTTERNICGVCDDEIEKDEGGGWKHKSGDKDHAVYQLTEMVFKNDRYTSSRHQAKETDPDKICSECDGSGKDWQTGGKCDRCGGSGHRLEMGQSVKSQRIQADPRFVQQVRAGLAMTKQAIYNDADIEMMELAEAADTAAAGVCSICEVPLNPLDPRWNTPYAKERASNPRSPSQQDDAEYYGPAAPGLPYHQKCLEEDRY